MLRIAVLLGCISTSLFAQRFRAGTHAGWVASQVDGDSYAGFNKLGAMFGASISKRISAGRGTASFEINYIQKGSRKMPNPEKGEYDFYKLQLNYAEVPVLLTYNLFVADTTIGFKNKFLLEGGIAFAALVHAQEENNIGQTMGATPFQKKEASFIFGIKYYLTSRIIFNLRSQYSILPVRKGGTSTYYPNWMFNYLPPGYYNNLINVVVHYEW
jgi:hypothetical protein